MLSLLIFLLLPLCTFFPGFAIARRMRLSPPEKLCASLGFSIVLLYLFQMAARITSPWWAIWAPIIGYIVCAALAFVLWHDALALLRHNRTRHMVIATVVLYAWSLLMLSVMSHYGGGAWAGDWLEHATRTDVWAGNSPFASTFYEGLGFTARPPLQNAAAAFFTAVSRDRFEHIQLVYAFFACLIVPVCLLLAPALARSSRANATVLVALLVTSPSICHNIVWTWTKMLTAVYVIAALHFYLRGWRRGSSLHLTIAFVLLTAGVLVHYSALVFAVFIFPHFLLMTILRRRVDLRQWLITGVICTLLLASWFAFSVIVFGAHQTFRGNSTAAGFSDSKAPSAAKVITAHCYYSLLPFAVRDPSLKVPQTNPPYGRVRDYWFRQYQTNLWGMIGSGGGLVALWLVIRSLRQDRRPNALDRWFWLAFLPVTYIVGCAVVPPPIETEGVAHACLLPLALLALTLIAAQFHRLPKWAKWTLAITRVWDFAIGVWFQLWMEGLTFALYTERLLPDNTPYRFDPSHRAEGRAVDNWATVQLAHTYFWGDNFRFALEPLRGLCAVAGAAAIIVVADLQGKLLPIWQRIRPAPKPVTASVGPSTRRERRRR